MPKVGRSVAEVAREEEVEDLLAAPPVSVDPARSSRTVRPRTKRIENVKLLNQGVVKSSARSSERMTLPIEGGRAVDPAVPAGPARRSCSSIRPTTCSRAGGDRITRQRSGTSSSATRARPASARGPFAHTAGICVRDPAEPRCRSARRADARHSDLSTTDLHARGARTAQGQVPAAPARLSHRPCVRRASADFARRF